MSYYSDTVFRDGTPSEDASDPLKTFGRLFDPLLNLEILSVATEGALSNVTPSSVSTAPEAKPVAPKILHNDEFAPLA